MKNNFIKSVVDNIKGFSLKIDPTIYRSKSINFIVEEQPSLCLGN